MCVGDFLEIIVGQQKKKKLLAAALAIVRS